MTDSAVAFVWLNSPDGGRRVFNATVNDNGTSDPVFANPGYWIPIPAAP